MKIGIVGLGLMGGSIAMKLKQHHCIAAFDINPDSLKLAAEKGIVDETYDEFSLFAKAVQVVYLCLYPQSIIDFIKQNQSYFRPGTVLIDIAGIKTKLVKELTPILRNDLDFVFTHPIAGREKQGVAFATDAMFSGANYIITPTEKNKPEHLELVADLAKELGFRHVAHLTPEAHDEIIAYTSQLTHVLSLALVNSDDSHYHTSEFIGDSYRDLTRIAMINETLWSELFLSNKEHLLAKISDFQVALEKYRIAIESNNQPLLKTLMLDAKSKRKKIERG